MNTEQMKAQYLDFINAHSLNPNQFIIGAGGALLIRGYRLASSDIDVAVDWGTFNHLLARFEEGLLDNAQLLLGDRSSEFPGLTAGEFSGCHGSGKPVIVSGDFEIHLDPDMLKAGEWEVYDGVGIQSMQSLYDLKSKLNRPKDQNDLVLLQVLLNNPDCEVPRISAGVAILRRDMGTGAFYELQPRHIGQLMGMKQWLTLKDVDTLQTSDSLSVREHTWIVNLLIGNKLNGEDDQVGMHREVTDEFAAGARNALEAINY